MRIFRLWLVAMTLMSGPARAMVGDTSPAPELAKNLVMVLTREGSGAGFCTAEVLAPDIVLTAAHCVTKPANMRVHFNDSATPPRLIEVADVRVHPAFHADAIKTRERSVDLALVRLKAPLPPEFKPLPLSETAGIDIGAPLELAGYGLTKEGDARSSGTLMRADVTLRAPLSNLLLWMEGAGASSKNTGACTGDSGGAVLQSGTLVGVISWTEGEGGHHCGKLTQAISLAPQVGWVKGVMKGW